MRLSTTLRNPYQQTRHSVNKTENTEATQGTQRLSYTKRTIKNKPPRGTAPSHPHTEKGQGDNGKGAKATCARWARFALGQAPHTAETPGSRQQECPALPTPVLQRTRQWGHRQRRLSLHELRNEQTHLLRKRLYMCTCSGKNASAKKSEGSLSISPGNMGNIPHPTYPSREHPLLCARFSAWSQYPEQGVLGP